MDDGFEMGVVKVKGVRGDAVDQRGTCHVDAVFATGDAGLRCWLQHIDGGQSSTGSSVVARAYRATQPI